MHYITQNQGENAGFTVNVFSFIVQVTLTAINLAHAVVCWISIHNTFECQRSHRLCTCAIDIEISIC
jgi:hypothetical protein